MSDGCQAAPCWENQRWSCGLWCLSPPTHCQDTQGLSLNKVIAQTPAVLFSFALFSLLADLFVDCLLWLFKKRYSTCWFVEAVRESESFSHSFLSPLTFPTLYYRSKQVAAPSESGSAGDFPWGNRFFYLLASLYFHIFFFKMTGQCKIAKPLGIHFSTVWCKTRFYLRNYKFKESVF